MFPDAPMMVLPEERLRARVHDLMPRLWESLAELVTHQSVYGDPEPPLEVTAQTIAEMFHDVGITTAQVDHVTHNGRTSAPLVLADQVAHEGLTTVLLYAHYDVQPADESGWRTKPFKPETIDDENHDPRMYGRGAADDKSGVMMHLGAIQALRGNLGQLPLNIKVVLEGEEETGGSVLEQFLAANEDDKRFHADLIIIADTGNVRVGAPTLTETLRGIVVADVEVETLAHKVHSGMYGGPIPDAFMALVQMLASLQDPSTGDVSVAGLKDYDHPGWPTVSEAELRAAAGVLPRTNLIGSGTLQKLLYGKSSVNVIGLSGLPLVSGASSALCPKAKARVSLRLAPNQDPGEAFAHLRDHLVAAAPWGLEADVRQVGEGAGFITGEGEHQREIEEALCEAYQVDAVVRSGQGGSIPLVNAFRGANPTSDVVLWGCEEPRANIHGKNESVSWSELEHMTLAEALLLQSVMSPIPLQQ
ncbi:M20/M25/M40 family metallo-hydrolase [Actinokineospora enzanensis]|uniref:M20/M25/M40 family metallo-hydrolase n=1 Tax=Actinokineospora enzanensis TaxID=155975 RepID=UPI000374F013|nr:M20/M25/M40 family metallo-hydrolase [Actinokineospora enzanensis]